MTPNHKLTNVIKGRIVEDLQMNTAEVSMRFSDGSTMLVKVMESNSPPLKNGARIRTVSEQSVKFTVSCEDESQITLTLADPGSSVTVRDANGKVEYLGSNGWEFHAFQALSLGEMRIIFGKEQTWLQKVNGN
jgi:hypothetical protein